MAKRRMGHRARTPLCGTIPERKTLAPGKNGERHACDRRRSDHLLLTCQATVPTLIILMTTVSCSRPAADMPQPRDGFVKRELSFSGRVIDGANRQLVQRGEGQPMARREQPRTSASPKVATVQPPNATSAAVSRHASEKANTPPLLDAERKQLFQEFLEWRRRQRD